MYSLSAIVILTFVIDMGHIEASCPNCRLEDCDGYGICLKGCKDKRWGNYCHKNCPEYCAACYQVSGECSRCHKGKWGVNCERHCPELCVNQECSQTNGSCVRCQSGSWGQRCENLCSDFCFNSTCDINSGKCLKGCGKGRCGDTCNLWCSPGCFDDVCLQTGTCISGCKKLFYGKPCDKRCSSNCLPPGCHKQTGLCVACQIGFYGNFCTIIYPNCINSTYDKRDGYCIHGCESEWSGYKCDVNKISSISKINVALVLSICFGVVASVFILIFILRKGGRKWWPRPDRLKFALTSTAQETMETGADVPAPMIDYGNPLNRSDSHEHVGSAERRNSDVSGPYEVPIERTNHVYASIIG